MAEFKKLSEVELIESTSANTTVLVEEGGEIKRVAKSEVGGAGGYIVTVTMNDLESSSSDAIIVSENYDAMYDVLCAGGNVCIDVSILNSMNPAPSVMSYYGSSSSSPAYPSVYGQAMVIVYAWVLTDAGLLCEVMYQGYSTYILFPNGSHNLEKPEEDK